MEKLSFLSSPLWGVRGQPRNKGCQISALLRGNFSFNRTIWLKMSLNHTSFFEPSLSYTHCAFFVFCSSNFYVVARRVDVVASALLRTRTLRSLSKKQNPCSFCNHIHTPDVNTNPPVSMDIRTNYSTKALMFQFMSLFAVQTVSVSVHLLVESI